MVLFAVLFLPGLVGLLALLTWIELPPAERWHPFRRAVAVSQPAEASEPIGQLSATETLLLG